MFGELPKLFDRNFAIAYFLPVSLFLAASSWLLISANYWSTVSNKLTGNTLFDATLAIFLAWIISILLMVLNREIFRVLEGYGKYNPLRIFTKRVKNDYRKKLERLDWLDEEYSKQTFSEELRKERTRLLQELAENYPDKEDLVLPTIFGNALRAFEVYPRIMYGFDAIDGWSRLLAVVPKDYRELIDDAKAQVDWWANLGVMSFVFLIEFWIVVFGKWGLQPYWYNIVLNITIPIIVFGLLSWFLQWRAMSAVVGWGNYVRSAFDVYRFTLLETLGVDIPKTRVAEKALWMKLSQATLYRLPYVLPELKKTTKRKSKA